MRRSSTRSPTGPRSPGASAAAHCFSKAVTESEGSPSAYLTCTADADDSETRANTVTKAFELGLEIGTVIDKTIFAKNDPAMPSGSATKPA